MDYVDQRQGHSCPRRLNRVARDDDGFILASDTKSLTRPDQADLLKQCCASHCELPLDFGQILHTLLHVRGN